MSEPPDGPRRPAPESSPTSGYGPAPEQGPPDSNQQVTEPPATPDERPALAERHLHPVAAALAALDSVRDAIVSVVVLVVIGSQSGRLGNLAAVLAVGGALIAVTLGIARWRAETYTVVDGTIRHRRGLISREETVVPLARVHSIDTAQGPLQRLFGVHELHVQTAGGGARGEIVLRAVEPSEARRLRTVAGLPADPVAPDRPRWRLGGRGLIAVGLTAPQLGILLPLAAGTAALADNIFGDTGIRDAAVDAAPTEASGIAMLALLVLVVLWAVAFAGSLVVYAGFSVVRDGDHLRIERGFLQRRATTVPLARVHAISVAEGPLRRPFGLCSVRLETAGYGSEAGAARTLFPLLRLADLDGQLAELVPGLALERATAPARQEVGGGPSPATLQAGARGAEALAPDGWRRPPQRALRRYLLPRVLVGLLAGAILTVAVPSLWPLLPALALAGVLVGVAAFRAAGWRLAGGRLAARHGALTRRTVLVSAGRLQDHSLAQTPFQRRARLATFSMTVASGTSAAVAHLDVAPSQALFDSLRPIPDS